MRITTVAFINIMLVAFNVPNQSRENLSKLISSKMHFSNDKKMKVINIDFLKKKPIILNEEYSNNILYNLHDKTNSFSILVASR